MTLTNNNTITANASGVAMILDPGTGGFINNGNFRASGGGILRLLNGSFDNMTTGVIEALAGSRVELSGASITGGLFQTFGDGLIRSTGGNTLDGITVTGALEQMNGADNIIRNSLTVDGVYSLKASSLQTDIIIGTAEVIFSGSGTIVLSNDIDNRIYGTSGSNRLINRGTIEGAGQIGLSQMILENFGTIEASGSARIIVDLTNANPLNNEGILKATGSGGFDFREPLTNAGTVEIATGSKLIQPGNYVQTAGSTIVNGNLNPVGSVEIQGGRLSGSGTVSASVNNLGGTVGPGNTAGILTVTGDFSQDTNSNLEIEIGGTTVGSQYDQLAVTGGASLSGTLKLSLIDGYTATLDDTFVILTSNNLTGFFQRNNFPNLGSDLFFSPFISGNSVHVSVVKVTNYSEWAATHFDVGELADQNISGKSADPDGDGILNLLEYAFRLNPEIFDHAPFEIGTASEAEGTFLTFTFPFVIGPVDVDYVLETSTDLSTWATAASDIVQIVSGEITLKATTPIDTLDLGFYRLRVFEPQ